MINVRSRSCPRRVPPSHQPLCWKVGKLAPAISIGCSKRHLLVTSIERLLEDAEPVPDLRIVPKSIRGGIEERVYAPYKIDNHVGSRHEEEDGCCHDHRPVEWSALALLVDENVDANGEEHGVHPCWTVSTEEVYPQKMLTVEEYL